VIDRSTRWYLLQHYRRLRHIGDGRCFWHGLHFNQQLRRADLGIVSELSRSSTSTNERTHGYDSFDYPCIDPTNDTFANSRPWSEKNRHLHSEANKSRSGLQTNPGQDLFIRGGIDATRRPPCTDITSDCCIPFKVLL